MRTALTTSRTSLVLCLALIGGSARATELQPVTSGQLTVSLPRGWTVTTDPARQLFVAQQDPRRKDSASALVMVSAATSATEDQLIDTVAAQLARDLRVLRRGPREGGGTVLVADGTAGTVPVRLGATAVAGGGGAMVALLVSRPEEFEPLGGIRLVNAMLGSLAAAPGPLAPAASAVPPARTGLPRLTIRDLAGTWSTGGTSISTYVHRSTGAYAGYSSYSSDLRYVISADGKLRVEGSSTSSGMAGLRAVDAAASGTVSLSPEGLLELRTTSEGKTRSAYYGIRGWRQEADRTVLVVNGPWWPRADGTIDPDALAPGRATNLEAEWVRSR